METTLILAIYGAIISTIAIVWNIINSISQYKGKIRIELLWNYAFESGGTELIAKMQCRVVNIGRRSRYIQMPRFECISPQKMHPEITGTMKLLQGEPPNEYPKELKPGQVHSLEYNLNNYLEFVFEQLDPNDKLYFYVLDTHGKKYSSDYLKAKQLIEYVRQGKSFIRARLTTRSS
jgi:hypothetical protein